MRALIRVADAIARLWRPLWWCVLDGVGVAVIAAAADREHGHWWGLAVLVAGVAAIAWVVIERARARVHAKTKDTNHA